MAKYKAVLGGKKRKTKMLKEKMSMSLIQMLCWMNLTVLLLMMNWYLKNL